MAADILFYLTPPMFLEGEGVLDGRNGQDENVDNHGQFLAERAQY